MDPISAIGVAAAVAQFCQIGFQVARRLSEYNSVSQHDIPKSLRSITAQLPLLLNALNRSKSDADLGKFDTDTRCIIRGVVIGCTKLIEDVDEILAKVARQDGESVGSKVKKVLASFKHEEKIKAIDKNLQTYVQVLILHHVVDPGAVASVVVEEPEYFDVRQRVVEPFYPRLELIQMLGNAFYKATRSQVQTPTVVILTGEKGVGKSQLALDYCYQSRDLGQFQTVFWLDAGSPEALELSLESVAAVIRRSTSGSRNDKLAFVDRFLSERWHPWLLVLDNYVHKGFEEQHVMRKLPSRGYGAILITTRNLGASGLGHPIPVSKFLSAEENNNLRDRLSGAVETRNIEEARSVLAQGFNVNQVTTNLGWPFLNRAAAMEFEDGVDLFLKHGANVDLKPSMTCPLEWAARDGYLAIVNRLLDHEDEHSIRLNPPRYESAVRKALENAHLGTIRTLVSRRQVILPKKANYNRDMFVQVVKKGNEELLRYVVEHGLHAETDLEKGEALRCAAENAKLDILKLLISEKGFSPNLMDERGHTPLQYASWLQGYEEEVGAEIVRFLLDAGGDPNLSGPNSDKELPIHRAAVLNHTSKIRILLDAGADPTRMDRMALLPLTSAVKYNSPEAMDMLLAVQIDDIEKRKVYWNEALQYAARHGNRDLMLSVLRTALPKGEVDINHKDWRRQTPLLLTVYGEYAPAARLLLRYDPDQSIVDDSGQLPLLLAAEKGLDLVVRDLLRAKNSSGPEGVRDKQGNSALHIAASKGQEQVVKVLLDAGADKDDMNEYGDTPIDVAEEMRLDKIIAMLNAVSAK